MRGGIWLGDALEAARVLAPDPQALAVLLRSLGLVAEPAAPATAATHPPPPPPPPPPAPPTPPAPAPVPPPASTAGPAGDHRLPTRLESLAPAPPPAPAPWQQTPPLRADTLQAPPARPAAPLLAPRQRRALLGALLATEVADGEPDVARIVDELAAGRPLHRLPRRPRRTLARGAEVLVDDAPWLHGLRADQRELAAYLRHLLPPERVAVRRIDGAPPPDIGPRLAEGAPVLLLSDLGIGRRPRARGAATPAEWQAWALRLRRRGHEVRALVPHSPARWPAVPAMRLLPWSEQLDLAAVRRARAGATHRHAPTAEADEDTLAALAQRLAPALRVSPRLLRDARRSLHLGPGAELDFAASHWVRSAGAAGLVLQPGALAELREALADDGAAREAALALTRSARADAGFFGALEETLVEHELSGTLDDAEAERQLAAVTRSAAEPGAAGDAVAAWAAQAWGRFSPALRATPAARRLAFAAAARVQGRSWLMAPAAGAAGDGAPLLPDDAAALFRRLPEAALSVQLRQYADGSVNLVIGPAEATTTALHRLHAPLTGAVWLQVQAGDAAPQTLRCEPGAVVQLEVPAETALTLRTLEGRAWRLAPDTLLGQLQRASLVGDGLPLGALVLADRLAWAPVAPASPTRTLLVAQDRTEVVGRRITPSGNGPMFPGGFLAMDGRSPPPFDPSVGEYLADSSAGAEAPRTFRLDANGRPHPETQPVNFNEPQWVYQRSSGWSIRLNSDAEIPFAELVDRARQVAGNWTFAAFAVDDGIRWQRPLEEMLGRLGHPNRITHELERATAILALGVRAPDIELPQRAFELIEGGLPFLVIGRETELDTWPPALQTRARANRLDPDEDAERLARQVLAWSPWQQARAAPAGKASLGTSLRARLADLMEQAARQALGLLRIEPDGDGWRLQPAPPPEGSEPLLVLLHGEVASTEGSFGALLREPALRRRLEEAYPGRVCAFQYRSVSVGPLTNARLLVEALPPGARLHLVSMGAGGLLGELLTLNESDPVSFTPGTMLERDVGTPVAPGAEAEPDAALAHSRLLQALSERRPRVERFVRIACPAGGTRLFSEGLDRGLSFLKMVPLVGTAMSLLPGADRLLSDVDANPGLTALHPDRGLPPLLAGLATGGGRLRVMAAVREGGGFLQRALQGVARWALNQSEGDDLVVPLASALGGIERHNGVDVLVARGDDVSHFVFMERPDLREAIVQAILTPEFDVPPGFERLPSLAEARARHAPAPAAA